MLERYKRNNKLRLIFFCILTASLAFSLNVELALGYTDITPEDVKIALETEKVYLLDVRTLNEYVDGHLPDAYLIPHTELEDRRCELPVNMSYPIIVYCASGRRSAIAANLLDSWGYVDVRNMLGGFSSWPYEVEYGRGTVLDVNKANCNTVVPELSHTSTGWVFFGILVVPFLLVLRKRDR